MQFKHILESHMVECSMERFMVPFHLASPSLSHHEPNVSKHMLDKDWSMIQDYLDILCVLSSQELLH